MLARELARYARRDDVVVLALPRGGVPVGYEVAKALGAPLDALVVRKLGLPGNEELAMGALASGGILVLQDEVVEGYGVTPEVVAAVAEREKVELARRESLYRAGRPPLDLRGKVVILVDDGIATGATMDASVQSVRSHGPRRVVVAVPVGPPETCARFGELADEVVCSLRPPRFFGVGGFYRHFPQTSDEEVRHLLADCRAA